MKRTIGTVKLGQQPELDAAVKAAMAKGEAEIQQATTPAIAANVEQAEGIAPGKMRIHIVSPDHTDGKAKKTWLRDSVIEIDQYTAMVMVNDLKCAYPTDEPLNEILLEYNGK